MDYVRRIMQERNLAILVRNKGFQFKDTFFPYTSGEIGPYYIQCGDVMNNGNDYSMAVDDMARLVEISLIPGSYDVVSGGESRDWIFSLPVSNKLRLPHSMIYKDKRVIGVDMNGKKVIHIADLNNEGSSVRDLWAPIITEHGGEMENIFFYVDRMEGGVQVVDDLGLNSYAVVPLNKRAWGLLQDWVVIDETVYRNLIERMEDKDVWARKMLKTDKGLETLANLFSGSEKDFEKGRKILIKGYPDMQGELLDRLKRSGIEVENVLGRT